MADEELKPVAKLSGDDLWFFCPGCDSFNRIPVKGPKAWTWNGDLIKPTLTPSILTTGGTNGFTCHAWLKAGVMEFLNDCTHKFKGQHVPLEEYPEGW